MERRRGHEEATEGLQRVPYLAQSSVQRTGFLVQGVFCNIAPWGGHSSSVPLMKWLLTSCVHNSLQAK